MTDQTIDTDVNEAEVENATVNGQTALDWRLAGLCILLGAVCLLFALFGPNLARGDALPGQVFLFSICMAFGLFLTAVGGWASGKWGGWTFGGAAATVVALFLLILFSNESDKEPIVAQVKGQELYGSGKIAAVEAREEEGASLFVKPNRELNHAHILIENSDLASECIHFIFRPQVAGEDGEADAETFRLTVPVGLIVDNSAKSSEQRLKKIVFDYKHNIKTLLYRDKEEVDPVPANLPIGSAFCGSNSVRMNDGDGYFSRFASLVASVAFAGEQSAEAIIAELVSEDSFIRRDARARLAKMGPEVLPKVFAAIPKRNDRNHYRYALGAMVVVSLMAEGYPNLDEVRAALSDANIKTIVRLMFHRNKTLEDWATTAVLETQDERSVELMASMSGAGSSGLRQKVKVAQVLQDFAIGYSEKSQSVIISKLESGTNVSPQIKSVVSRLKAYNPEKKEGWVYLGTNFKGNWNSRNFSWNNGSADLPQKDTMIVADSNVNILSDHAKFSLDSGWKNGDIVGVAKKGGKLKVEEIKEVTPGFYWAKVK